MSVEFTGKQACIAPEGVFLVGKIIAQQADEAVLTDGVVDYDKLQPIIFDIATKTYRLVGPVVGKAFHDGLKLK